MRRPMNDEDTATLLCFTFSDILFPNCTDVLVEPANAVVGNETQTASASTPLVSDSIRFYLELCVMILANLAVSLLGTASNIVNIVTFSKMGVADVVNVSLLALAVSDLISVFLVVWLSICNFLVLLDPPGLPFDPTTFMYVTAGWPHFIFSRVTCYITAMVSIERCLCVVAPFKVKEIITPGRVKACLVLIFLIFPSAYLPVLLVHRMAWKFDPRHNESRIMADFTENRDEVQAMSYYVNDLFLPTVSIVVVMLCAALTSLSLQRNARWKRRMKMATVSKDKRRQQPDTQREKDAGNTSTIPNKEMKVARMLVVICLMFVVCYAPSVALLYIRFWYPELAMFRAYHNLFICIYSFVFLLEVSNSSLNIVIYYMMSSKYKTTLRGLFCFKTLTPTAGPSET